MASIKGRYEYPDGATPGKSKEGGLDQNIYDDQGNLVGHARFIPDDESDDDYGYRYADLCRSRHKSAYAEDRVMPTGLPEGLPGGQVVAVGTA
jgi:hypothetical protein